MQVADAIAQWLFDKGVSHAFCIVGAGNLALLDAIARLQKTEIIACHHEQAAAMAAGFHWRASGHLAAAIVTTGAGSSNALTGVLAAFMDSTPLIVISGNEPSKYLDSKTRVLGVQGFHSARAASVGMVKWSNWASQTKMPIMQQLDLGYMTATEPRFGPAWIDICRDQQTANVR